MNYRESRSSLLANKDSDNGYLVASFPGSPQKVTESRTGLGNKASYLVYMLDFFFLAHCWLFFCSHYTCDKKIDIVYTIYDIYTYTEISLHT